MNITQCSKQLRELINEHENYKVSLENYRFQRKILLDALDKTVNGVNNSPKLTNTLAVAQQGDISVQPDKTQPYLLGKIDKCISFLKRDNKS
jgi:hypothetical protein